MDKYFAPINTQGAQPSMRSVLAGKEATWRADMAVGRFFYDACIPINAMNSFYFKPMLDVISTIGLGYKGPNYHQLRVNLLKDAKKEVQLLVNSYRAIWAKVGCTIMGDGWTDNRQRTLINFLVYCYEGISFVKYVDVSNIVKDATNLFILFDVVIEWVGPLNVVHIVTDNATNYVDIGKMDHVVELVRRSSKENFCNKPTVIGGFMDVIDQKVLKGKLETMNEMKLFRNRLGSFGRDLAYSSREVLQLGSITRKKIYDTIDYACIDETNFWIVDDDQPVELDVEELENLLYEEWSIPINEVEGSSSHIDDEDGGGVAIEGLDVENFGFPDAHFQSPYSNFQNE
ncbi:hypothetical protein CK203_086263 [Vitis vinifera]|uniref:DUF659 domain-containing protein n=1 Tax=Vitis vinifera TaxID=29760 RepID=A0A438EDS3_VITVI|nr:hypothetical protein CK203_086263 [Vitis vinifera]